MRVRYTAYMTGEDTSLRPAAGWGARGCKDIVSSGGDGGTRMPNLSVPAIASFATSLIPVAHMEIRHGYHALLLSENFIVTPSPCIDRVCPGGTTASTKPGPPSLDT